MLTSLNSYIIGITLFYTVISSIPFFNNPVYLPKVTILIFGAFLLAGLQFLILQKQRKKTIPITSFHVIIIAFGLVHTLALLFSKSRSVSFYGLYTAEVQNYLFVIVVLAFSLLTSLNKPSKIPQLFFLAGTMLHVCFVLYQGVALKIPRPNGLEGHPIWSAGVIALGLLIALDDLKSYRILKLLFVILCVAGLTVLDSTTAWIALGLSLGSAVLLRFAWKTKILTFFVLGALLLAYFLPKEDFSLQKRLLEYRSIRQFLVQNKLSLLGNGQNTSGLLLLPFRNMNFPKDNESLYRFTTVHNQYIEVFFSTGILGLICWLFLLYLGLKNSNTLYKRGVLLFFLTWQLLYYLPFTLFCMLFFVLSQKQVNKNQEVFQLSGSQVRIFFIATIFLLIPAVYFVVNGIRAEIAYRNKGAEQALFYSPNNDHLLRESSFTLLEQALACYALDKETPNVSTRMKPVVYGKSSPGFSVQPVCSNGLANELSQTLLERLKTATLVNPIHPDNWNAYGTALFRLGHVNQLNKNRGKFLQSSQKALQQAVRIEPTDPLYLDNLGLTYLDAKNFGKAEFYFQKALEIDPLYTVSLNHLKETRKQRHESE